MIRMRDKEHLDYLLTQGVSQEEIDSTDIRNLDHLVRLKRALQMKYP